MRNVTAFDLIISGGGMTGSTLALLLSQAVGDQLSIAVVEPFQAQNDAHPGFDARSIALSHGTVDIFKRFQLWSLLSPFASPITHISVTDKGHAGMTDITASDYHLDALGYVVELEKVGEVFSSLLKQRASITYFCPNKTLQVTRQQDCVDVQLSDGQVISAKLFVAADGALSDACQQLGLGLNEHDFNQAALIANVALKQPHAGRAFERFTPSGPLALLPMSENRMSLVWCASPDTIDELMQLDSSEFLQRLQSEFGWRLGQFDDVGLRHSYPLIMRSQQHIISHRCCVLGNAAQTLHPIAGQGFNLGIRDAVGLVELIKQSSSLQDVGAFSLLSQYQALRTHDRALTMQMTSSLVHIYSNAWWPTLVGRNLSLMLLDNFKPLKQPLIKRTLGLVSR